MWLNWRRSVGNRNRRNMHRVHVGLVWMCTEYTGDWYGYASSTRGTGIDMHRVHGGLVWICTEYTWDWYAYAPSTRGLLWIYTEYTWDLYGSAPSTRGTCMDMHQLHVGLVWICTEYTWDWCEYLSAFPKVLCRGGVQLHLYAYLLAYSPLLAQNKPADTGLCH
jgi:hypothetical protein